MTKPSYFLDMHKYKLQQLFHGGIQAVILFFFFKKQSHFFLTHQNKPLVSRWLMFTGSWLPQPLPWGSHRLLESLINFVRQDRITPIMHWCFTGIALKTPAAVVMQEVRLFVCAFAVFKGIRMLITITISFFATLTSCVYIYFFHVLMVVKQQREHQHHARWMRVLSEATCTQMEPKFSHEPWLLLCLAQDDSWPWVYSQYCRWVNFCLLGRTDRKKHCDRRSNVFCFFFKQTSTTQTYNL